MGSCDRPSHFHQSRLRLGSTVSALHQHQTSAPEFLCDPRLRLDVTCAYNKMAEAPIGMQTLRKSPQMLSLMRDPVLDGGTGFLKAGYAGQVRPDEMARTENEYSHAMRRTFPTTNTLPSSGDLYCGRKSKRPGMSSSKTLCAETRRQQRGRCCRSHTRYEESSVWARIGPSAD